MTFLLLHFFHTNAKMSEGTFRRVEVRIMFHTTHNGTGKMLRTYVPLKRMHAMKDTKTVTNKTLNIVLNVFEESA